MSNPNKFTERGTITVDARQGQENGRDWVTIAVARQGKLFSSTMMRSSATVCATRWSRLDGR
jgi:hypothetical protein